LWWVEAASRISQRRYPEALELLDRLLAVELVALPDEGPAYDERIFDEFAHEARGACLFRLGRYAEAADAYAAAARIDPANLAYGAKFKVALGRAGQSRPTIRPSVPAARSGHQPDGAPRRDVG
jgi:tetratricopeptide (TPR) repeat protein